MSVRARERPDSRTGGLLGAALAAALLFSLSVLPVAGLLSVVSPFPLILQRLRSGTGSALLASLLAAALLGAAFSAGQALAFMAVLAAPGLLIGEAMARGRGLPRGCAWAFGLLSLEILVALFFSAPQMASHVLAPIEQYRSPEFLQDMRRSGLPPERVEDWAERFATFERVLQVVYPAAFIILGAMVVLANAALLRGYLARLDPGWLDGGEFEGIRWPLGLAVAFVASGLSVVVPPLRPAGYNVLLVLAFFFALQGLAVIAYYAHRLAAPPLLRLGIVILILVNPWAPQMVALLGLFDLWFDFRRWAQPPEDEKG